MDVGSEIDCIERGEYEPVLAAGMGPDGAALRDALAERARAVREKGRIHARSCGDIKLLQERLPLLRP